MLQELAINALKPLAQKNVAIIEADLIKQLEATPTQEAGENVFCLSVVATPQGKRLFLTMLEFPQDVEPAQKTMTLNKQQARALPLGDFLLNLINTL